jgi:hypothetical protein
VGVFLLLGGLKFGFKILAQIFFEKLDWEFDPLDVLEGPHQGWRGIRGAIRPGGRISNLKVIKNITNVPFIKILKHFNL